VTNNRGSRWTVVVEVKLRSAPRRAWRDIEALRRILVAAACSLDQSQRTVARSAPITSRSNYFSISIKWKNQMREPSRLLWTTMLTALQKRRAPARETELFRSRYGSYIDRDHFPFSDFVW